MKTLFFVVKEDPIIFYTPDGNRVCVIETRLIDDTNDSDFLIGCSEDLAEDMSLYAREFSILKVVDNCLETFNSQVVQRLIKYKRESDYLRDSDCKFLVSSQIEIVTKLSELAHTH